jgi:phosphoribosylformimino-5-aminoimidazole carboxamide ribotide isomerase
MILFPAIDLRHGRCVRLAQGRFEDATVYASDPLDVAAGFEQAGAVWLPAVDLDGAEAGQAAQTELLLSLAKRTGLRVQAGGGLRTADQVARLLDGGVARVVIGSLAVRNPALTRTLLERFGAQKVVMAVDVRVEGGVARVDTAGWQGGATTPLDELLLSYADSELCTILCTDIARDGMLQGPNVELYRGLREGFPALDVLASGGVGRLADLCALKALGVGGAVVGKALYEGRFTLAQALAAAC